MPVDERLREGLRLEPESLDPPDVVRLLGEVVERAERRRRRRAQVVVGVAAAGLALALLAPTALRSMTSDREPTVEPTSASSGSTTLGWRPASRGTPVDDKSWKSEGLPANERLAVLDGTGLEKFGPVVMDKAGLANRSAGISLWQGALIIRITDLIHRFPAHETGGTFTAQGHRLTFRVDGFPGKTELAWRLAPNGPGSLILRLDFVSTTVDRMYGAPAEVFWRLWTARPFVVHRGA